MSYVLAFLGFAVLILLHEAGHFVAAKAVGMRVERFSLFFGPMLWKVRRGETEYGVGAIPLGGYVKITGMNPREEIPEEAKPRAYYNQPVWKRIVVILAGPFVNLMIAFLIIWMLLLSQGQQVVVKKVGAIGSGTPAALVLKPGDQIVSVDGVSGSPDTIRNQIRTPPVRRLQVNGCRAATPAQIVVRRNGQLVHVTAYPKYVAADKALELGFAFDTREQADRPGPRRGADRQRHVERDHADGRGRRCGSSSRRSASSSASVVGGYTVTQQSFAHDTTQAL